MLTMCRVDSNTRCVVGDVHFFVSSYLPPTLQPVELASSAVAHNASKSGVVVVAASFRYRRNSLSRSVIS